MVVKMGYKKLSLITKWDGKGDILEFVLNYIEKYKIEIESRISSVWSIHPIRHRGFSFALLTITTEDNKFRVMYNYVPKLKDDKGEMRIRIINVKDNSNCLIEYDYNKDLDKYDIYNVDLSKNEIGSLLQGMYISNGFKYNSMDMFYGVDLKENIGVVEVRNIIKGLKEKIEWKNEYGNPFTGKNPGELTNTGYGTVVGDSIFKGKETKLNYSGLPKKLVSKLNTLKDYIRLTLKEDLTMDKISLYYNIDCCNRVFKNKDLNTYKCGATDLDNETNDIVFNSTYTILPFLASNCKGLEQDRLNIDGVLLMLMVNNNYGHTAVAKRYLFKKEILELESDTYNCILDNLIGDTIEMFIQAGYVEHFKKINPIYLDALE